jgi:Uma2 family endonuclease
MRASRLTTARDLHEMGSDAHYELFRGELVWVPYVTPWSNQFTQHLAFLLYQHVNDRDLGIVLFGDPGVTIEANPDTVVAPDIAFVERACIPEPIDEDDFLAVIPNLIVEVASATDDPNHIQRKRETYDRVGVPLLWWIDPLEQTAMVHSHGKVVAKLDRDGVLDPGLLIPGFTMTLESLFSEA